MDKPYNLIAGGLGALFLLLLTIACLFVPHKIQRYFVNFHDRHGAAKHFNPFVDWARTPGYLLYLRVIGIFCLLCFLLITLVIGIEIVTGKADIGV